MKNNTLTLLITSVLIMLFLIPALTSTMLESYTEAVRETEYEKGWIKGYKTASMYYNSNNEIIKVPITQPPLIVQDMYNLYLCTFFYFRHPVLKSYIEMSVDKWLYFITIF